MRKRFEPTPEDQAAVERALTVKVMGLMAEDDPRKSGGDYYVCWIPQAQVLIQIPVSVVKKNGETQT